MRQIAGSPEADPCGGLYQIELHAKITTGKPGATVSEHAAVTALNTQHDG